MKTEPKHEIRPWNKKIEPRLLRKTILRMAMAGNSVHLGSSFSLVEILATLYQDFVRLNWHDRKDANRDVLGLSKGHGVMALYACFREFGWIDEADVENYFSSANQLKGLSSALVPGVEVSGGSLGHGITVCVGMALAAKLKGQDKRVFCIVGDGELNEGSVWESLFFAAHHKLGNLVVIVDANRYQAMGESNQILNLESFAEKFKALHFQTFEVDGHDQSALHKAFDSAIDATNAPKVVVARTVKGKGVSFMEDNNEWHYQRLNQQTFAEAMSELSE